MREFLIWLVLVALRAAAFCCLFVSVPANRLQMLLHERAVSVHVAWLRALAEQMPKRGGRRG